MSSLEMNKVAAAVLTAGVVAMGSGFIGDILTHGPELTEHAFMVESEEGAGADVAAAAPAVESVLPLLAAADPAAGEKVAKKCSSCHTFEAGGANRIGPNLWDTVNRPIGSVAGFGYSAGLAGRAETAWTYEELDLFLANPKGYAPDTKMNFAGLKKVKDRAALIAYMRSLSDAPAALPEADAGSDSGADPAATGDAPADDAAKDTAEDTAGGGSEEPA